MVPVQYPPKSVVMEAGDDDINFFCIRSGECVMDVVTGGNRLFSRNMVPMEVRLSPGDTFGHMFAEPAPSAVRTRSSCVLWQLDRRVFTDIKAFQSERRRADFGQFLATSVPLLKGTDGAFLQEVAASLEQVPCQKGHI